MPFNLWLWEGVGEGDTNWKTIKLLSKPYRRWIKEIITETLGLLLRDVSEIIKLVW